MPHAQMKLEMFRVTNFRSVRDSGWINAGDVTSLIGTNESGKTNLLMPLWKLNPAKEGEIKLIADAPRKDYNTYRATEKKPIFIRARFKLSDSLSSKIAGMTGAAVEKVQIAEVSRDFGGKYYVGFPDATPALTMQKADLDKVVRPAHAEISTMSQLDGGDGALKNTILNALSTALTQLDGQSDTIGRKVVNEINDLLKGVALEGAAAESTIIARFKQVFKPLAGFVQQLSKAGPNDSKEARELVRQHLPSFVYYSTYGNLDSEIYLPHVIEDLKRTDLSSRSEARARTLRVLFDFVRLQPQEILDLGKDHNEQNGRATDEQIAEFAEKKKERSVLLQSASTELTAKFRDWWKQGEYRFRFEADGNHFRIWVADDRRPEEIELEGRSTGLQWFLSFYLIFLVESTAAHNGAILLLDEPGHTLHPIAQRDLAAFFENLAKSNQLIYTTHSPFLIDADHLDRVRAVFVDDAGSTAVSTDLRSGQVAAQSKSVYPVHAALGLSVSDTLFQGCRPVIVEGTSDQLYLSAVKTHLIGTGKFSPTRELLFVPTSGVKAIKTVASILGGKDEALPVVLCDGDAAGTELCDNLKKQMYATVSKKVMQVSEFVSIKQAEVEDLFPHSFMEQILDRYLNGPAEAPFSVADKSAAIVPQIKAYAKNHNIDLKDGWKVEVARLVKTRLADAVSKGGDEWESLQAAWQQLFSRLSVDEVPEQPAKATKPTVKAKA